ncbi:hypothetical protein TNCV_3903281 [Trichonephila clavipes]|nr:hypothetical protein TNCV_3903281 [Trichonephila clavipes]
MGILERSIAARRPAAMTIHELKSALRQEWVRLIRTLVSKQTPTIVRFHVTVLSIDSIDEGSMVRLI